MVFLPRFGQFSLKMRKFLLNPFSTLLDFLRTFATSDHGLQITAHFIPVLTITCHPDASDAFIAHAVPSYRGCVS